MKNIMEIVGMGICTGCCACDACGNIAFQNNENGFYSPVVDEENCTGCGQCLGACEYAPQ